MSTTDFTRSIIQAETEFASLFAETTKTGWGRLYTCPQNTMATDGNTGVCIGLAEDPTVILRQTKAFYQEKNLPPRLRAWLTPDEVSAFLTAAKAVGGNTVTVCPALFMADTPPAGKPTPLTFDEEPFSSELRETVFCQHPHMEGILRHTLCDNSVSLIVGRLFGTAVTCATVWQTPAAAIISHVITAPDFRGYGFGEALILYLLQSLTPKTPVGLAATEENACRLYRRCGMKELSETPLLLTWENET